jgi:hypothetical protein
MRIRIRTLAPLAATLLAAACDSLQPVEPFRPENDPAKLFMSLRLDHHAVNLSSLAPYDELQLVATPRDGNGAVMAGLPAPTFRSTDTTRVQVSATGVLKARPRAGTANVIAEIRTSGNVVRADTAAVRVTVHATPPRMVGSLSIQPATPEAALWTMVPSPSVAGQLVHQLAGLGSITPRLQTTLLDVDGRPMTGLTIDYRTLDPDVATITRTGGLRAPQQPGPARIIASAWVYGVTIADTATYTATLPFLHGVLVDPGRNGGPTTVAPRTVTIRPGGVVYWVSTLPDSISVTFDDPAAARAYEPVCAALGPTEPQYCESGNIAPFQWNGEGSDVFTRARGRQFVQPGTYGYRIEPLGVTGAVIVGDAP